MTGAVLLAGLLTAITGGVLLRGDGPTDRLEAFYAAWAQADDRAAAALTDRPAAALRALTASRSGLDGARLEVEPRGDLKETGDKASGRARLRWRIPRVGTFTYPTRVTLEDGEDGWLIRWRPQIVHPMLTAETRLGTIRVAPTRGRIVDRTGAALVSNRPVVNVAVRAGLVRDPAAAADALAELTGVEAAPLAAAIRNAPRGRYVPVITLRQKEFDRISGRLEQIRGVSLVAANAPLAPDKTFARALLGTVAPVTAEQVSRSRGVLRAGDEIGQWGLQARYQDRLAGTASRKVVIRSTRDGTLVDTLLERRGRVGRPLRTTLSRRIQSAAEVALGATGENAALVAVEPASGDILAVANRPADSSYDRGRLGLYPPGSTFKVISTAALLRDGLSPDDRVDCPKTRVVDGRGFKNFEGRAQGAVPFRVDFAQSCNTAFVALAGRLARDALTETARDYGLGRTLRLGLPAADGEVPRPVGPVSRAAAMIGQDRIVASPLQMAGVAAAVADGRWRSPRLLASDRRAAGPRLPVREVAELRRMMRAVVDGGTGSALADLPGGPIGKSGTAEYGSGDPPPTHAWFIVARDGVAAAILVEGGRSGGEVAAPIAARFLARLDAQEEQGDG